MVRPLLPASMLLLGYGGAWLAFWLREVVPAWPEGASEPMGFVSVALAQGLALAAARVRLRHAWAWLLPVVVPWFATHWLIPFVAHFLALIVVLPGNPWVRLAAAVGLAGSLLGLVYGTLWVIMAHMFSSGGEGQVLLIVGGYVVLLGGVLGAIGWRRRSVD